MVAAEEELLKLKNDMQVLDIHFFTTRMASDQLEKGFRQILPFVTAAIVILIAFSSLSLVSLDCVESKPGLAIMAVISSVISTVASMGLLIYLQVPFIGLNKIAPFLILGIGLDDTFVLVAAWRRTNPRNSVAERMRETYSEAAVSVTITSVTDGLSFLIGALTDIPSIYIFCMYTGTAVVFLYFSHLTFFGGFLAYVGYGEKANRHSILCVKVPPRSRDGKIPPGRNIDIAVDPPPSGRTSTTLPWPNSGLNETRELR
ncbi:unnamed protein product, partial [Darwinula stevensoni]